MQAAPARATTSSSTPTRGSQRGALERLVAFADAHPQAAVVGPRLRYPDGRAAALRPRLPHAVAARHRVPVPAQARAGLAAAERVLRRRLRARPGRGGRLGDGRRACSSGARRWRKSGRRTTRSSSSRRRRTGASASGTRAGRSCSCRTPRRSTCWARPTAGGCSARTCARTCAGWRSTGGRVRRAGAAAAGLGAGAARRALPRRARPLVRRDGALAAVGLGAGAAGAMRRGGSPRRAARSSRSSSPGCCRRAASGSGSASAPRRSSRSCRGSSSRRCCASRRPRARSRGPSRRSPQGSQPRSSSTPASGWSSSSWPQQGSALALVGRSWLRATKSPRLDVGAAAVAGGRASCSGSRCGRSQAGSRATRSSTSAGCGSWRSSTRCR